MSSINDLFHEMSDSIELFHDIYNIFSIYFNIMTLKQQNFSTDEWNVNWPPVYWQKQTILLIKHKYHSVMWFIWSHNRVHICWKCLITVQWIRHSADSPLWLANVVTALIQNLWYIKVLKKILMKLQILEVKLLPLYLFTSIIISLMYVDMLLHEKVLFNDVATNKQHI